MGPRRGERAGWYFGWGGGSLWMAIPVVVCFVERYWWFGTAALAAAVLNVLLIVYLPPWKHPDVPLWKLSLPVCALQIVMISTIFVVFEPSDPSSRYLPYQLSLVILISLAIGRRRWNDGGPESKPVTAAANGLD